jgi:hypothetical protein
MSRILAALLATGCGLAVNLALAQDVKSDQTKQNRQEQIMEQKEQGANSQSPSDSGARDRATVNDGGTQQHARSPDANQAGQGTSSQSGTNRQIPDQSMPSVGHPKEGAATGQMGEKKYDETRSQSEQSGGQTKVR